MQLHRCHRFCRIDALADRTENREIVPRRLDSMPRACGTVGMIGLHISSPKTLAKRYLECFGSQSMRQVALSGSPARPTRRLSPEQDQRIIIESPSNADLGQRGGAASRLVNDQSRIVPTHELESKHRVTAPHVRLPRGGTVAADVHILTQRQRRERVKALALRYETLLKQRAIATRKTFERRFARIIEQQQNELRRRPEHVPRVFARVLPNPVRQRIVFVACSTHNAIAREHVCTPGQSAGLALMMPLAF
jgi:hypothetical protein